MVLRFWGILVVLEISKVFSHFSNFGGILAIFEISRIFLSF